MELLSIFKWQIAILLALSIFFAFFRKECAEFLREISWLKTKWFEIRRIREEIFAKAEEVKSLSEELEKDKKELREATKIFIESFYLSLATRNRFLPPDNVLQKILANLDLLAVFAIKDQGKRDKWIKEMQDLLNQK